jgi:hypothetical protein
MEERFVMIQGKIKFHSLGPVDVVKYQREMGEQEVTEEFINMNHDNLVRRSLAVVIGVMETNAAKTFHEEMSARLMASHSCMVPILESPDGKKYV